MNTLKDTTLYFAVNLFFSFFSFFLYLCVSVNVHLTFHGNQVWKYQVSIYWHSMILSPVSFTSTFLCELVEWK